MLMHMNLLDVLTKSVIPVYGISEKENTHRDPLVSARQMIKNINKLHVFDIYNVILIILKDDSCCFIPEDLLKHALLFKYLNKTDIQYIWEDERDQVYQYYQHNLVNFNKLNAILKRNKRKKSNQILQLIERASYALIHQIKPVNVLNKSISIDTSKGLQTYYY